MVITLDQTVELMGDHRIMSKGYVLTHCPFHDDSQMSLLVFDDGWYKCLAECERSGGTGPISKLYEELSNPGVIRHATNGHTEPPPRIPTDIENLTWKAHDTLRSNDEYRWYLKQRGVDDRIEVAKLGYYSGWITIPVFDEDNDIKGLVLRSTPPQQKVTGLRFIQPVGQTPMMYCPDWRMLRGADTLAIVFGMFDALVLSSIRMPVVTTTGGSKSFDAAWLDDWRKPVVIFPDAEGDDMAAINLAAQLGWRARIVRLPYDDDVQDPADYAKMERKAELMRLIGSELA